MSALKSVLIAALLTAGFAGSALARDQVFTLRLAQPLAAPTRVIALNAVWDCSGDTCTAHVNHDASVRACRQFAHQAGGVQVLSYGAEGAQLSADEIARCNGQSVTQQANNGGSANN